MKADSTSFLELIDPLKEFIKFQFINCKYDWKKEQCETLFNDIESIAKDTSGKSHFIGTIVYVDEYLDSSFHKLTIIDGQQRLTTIMLLLKAIADSGDDTMLKEEINNTYLKNTYCNKSLEIKLCPIEADAKIYRDLINGNLDDQSEYESNVIKN